MKNKNQSDPLLTEKVRNQWIVAVHKSTVFNQELEQFEALLKMLTRDEAHDLCDYTINYFKMRNVKTVFSPSVHQSVAAEAMRDELEAYLNRQTSQKIFKKVVSFRNLLITIHSTLIKSKP